VNRLNLLFVDRLTFLVRRAVFLAALALLPLCACVGDTPPGQLTREQLGWQWIANGAVVVDVRTAKEFAEAHLDDALNIPYDKIDKRTAELGGDKERQIVLYCRSGRRSGIAEKTLEGLGFTHVLNAGGLKDILKAREDKSQEVAAAPGPTPGEAANAEYRGIYEASIRLTEGVYEGKPFVEGGASRPTVQLVEDAHTMGDLDGDGGDEVVVILTENSGGSGSHVFVAVVARRPQGIVNLGTGAVGDRVQVRSIRVNAGHIELEVVQPTAADPMCCPSQTAMRRWELSTAGLVEKPPAIHGTLSMADLAGVEWTLTHFAWQDTVPENIEVTLTVDGDQIGGSGGCNRYFASMTESSPGEVTVSAIGATRMACAEERMDIETRYLTALGSVVKYSFLPGKLVLTGHDGDQSITMLFRSR